MMNLADPDLELIDPTPNVHAMFLNFDKTFFWAQLSSRCVVRWSKRMYSCAGTCSYEGRGGLCDIALSEPLLKLRPRKDMVETLLHEMIHAYLFVTNRDQDRDGHGPNFQAHMHRINRAAGLNISIYHDFHDEVKLYQTHWWRCNGPCQLRRPYFGIVRRSCNRAPGPSDCWWQSHQRNCGGTFIKFKEPDKPKKGKKTNAKPNADITKYISNNNNKDASNKNIIQNDKTKRPVLKDKSNAVGNPKVGVKTNNSSTLVVTKKNVTFSPQVPKSKPVVFSGTGQTIGTKKPDNVERKRTISNDVLETVRNVWVNKQIGTNGVKKVSKEDSIIASNPYKHKPDYHTESPPPKVKKIDDYFKTAATSVLKDLYGQDFKITQSKDDQKLKAVSTKNNLVDCPICNSKIDSDEINRHLDECLNKDVIEELSKEIIPVGKNDSYVNIKNENNNDVKRSNGEKTDNIVIDLTSIGFDGNVKPIKQITNVRDKNSKLRKSDSYIAPSTSNTVQKSPVDSRIKIESSSSALTKKGFDGNARLIKQITNARDKNSKLRKSDSFLVPSTSNTVQTPILVDSRIKIEASCSNSDAKETACPCCGDKLNTSVDEHLDECLSFFENDTTIPDEGTIIIDDDFSDEFDESHIFNETGTKLPCPCCLTMTEEVDMTSHLTQCLGDGS